MFRPVVFALLASVFSAAPCFATDSVPAGHSTVHIVFVVPQPPMEMGVGGMGVGGMLAGDKPMALVGAYRIPYDSIRPVSISIDGEFVGHALFGAYDITPIFVLPSGLRKFTFTCDGFKTTTAEIKVLGTGSKQYLIVDLPVSVGASNVLDDDASGQSSNHPNRG